MFPLDVVGCSGCSDCSVPALLQWLGYDGVRLSTLLEVRAANDKRGVSGMD